jgi:hypothetical protein
MNKTKNKNTKLINNNQLKFNFIKHEIENQLMYQRSSDGYVNATSMCKIADKRWNDYYVNQNTKEYIKELSSVTRIPVTALVCTIQGGIPELQGTWVHPKIAVHLAQWLSPKFALKVTDLVLDWYNKPKSSLPYHLRRYLANKWNVPIGHFSVLQEMLIDVIGLLEQHGYIVPSNVVPDISEGKLFAKYLRDKGVDVNNMPTYLHSYEDGRVVKARCYPMKHLEELKLHILQEWIPKRALKYFQERDVAALPYLMPILLSNEKYNLSLSVN